MIRVRSRTLVPCLVFLLVGFAIGLYVGWKEGAKTMGWLGAVGEGYMLAEIAYTQYKEAGHEDAKANLEGHLAYLEQLLPSGEEWQAGQSPFLSESGIAADKALTLARLALLEEREHGPGTGDALWARAEEQAVEAGWKDPSSDNLRRFVDGLDRASEE